MCYQIPALAKDGIVLVISPLIGENVDVRHCEFDRICHYFVLSNTLVFADQFFVSS